MSLITYSAGDIGQDLAHRAFYGTSFSPERRGDDTISEYCNHMQSVSDEFEKWATDDNREEMEADLESYRSRYASLLRAYLASHGNLVSTMIAGPANFPVRQMEKRGNWTDNHRNRLIEFSQKRLAKLRRKYDPTQIARAPISSDDDDAVERLREKIEKAEQRQALMKAVNKVVRKKDLTDEQKVAGIVELGLKETTAWKLLEPDFAGRIGFPSYELTNNNANIRRMKQRVEELEHKRQDQTSESDLDNGVTVIDNVEENRVQIIFPGKPSAEIRTRLKSNGFHWAPKWEGRPWQRKRSDYALQLAREIAENY